MFQQSDLGREPRLKALDCSLWFSNSTGPSLSDKWKPSWRCICECFFLKVRLERMTPNIKYAFNDLIVQICTVTPLCFLQTPIHVERSFSASCKSQPRSRSAPRHFILHSQPQRYTPVWAVWSTALPFGGQRAMSYLRSRSCIKLSRRWRRCWWSLFCLPRNLGLPRQSAEDNEASTHSFYPLLLIPKRLMRYATKTRNWEG